MERAVSWFISLIGQYANPQPALNNSPKHCDILSSRSALECCQEAAAILERLADTAANTDEDKNHLSLVQDRLAAAYLWQALLEHKATMEDNPWVESLEELSESYDTGEVLVHNFFFFRGCVNQAPVVQKVDNAIHWIYHYPVDSAQLFVIWSTDWIVIYPVNSPIQCLNNQGQKYMGMGWGWSDVIQCTPCSLDYLRISFCNLAPLPKSPSTGIQLQTYIMNLFLYYCSF